MDDGRDSPGSHLLHLIEAERSNAVNVATLQDYFLADAIVWRALDVLHALELGCAIFVLPALPQHHEADVHIGARSQRALAGDVFLLPQRDVHLRPFEDGHVEGLARPDAAGQPSPLPVLLPAFVHSTNIHDRKIFLDVLEGHPENGHLVVHGDVGAVYNTQLSFHLEGPLGRVLAPIACPSPWCILAPRISNLNHLQHLPSAIVHFPNVQDSVGMRCLQTHLQYFLLRLLASLLRATHAHEVPGFSEGNQL
mmetsp:Transcript_48040/g.121088  ORF Transcript_48040/g.121088 Transcript_48040/m.121088 type:complete len:252 (-) Transcript_48040:1649-2404(-)